MNVVQSIRRINEREAQTGLDQTASWHDQYKDSAYIFVGGLPFDLTEGDVICVFSQYGEVVNINLVRDKETGKSKGYAFLQYEDQRSTVLAVDNLNGITLLGRVLRVDHVNNYRQPKQDSKEEGEADTEEILPVMDAAPRRLDVEQKEEEEEEDDEVLMQKAGIDPEDPMAAYYLEKYKKKQKKSGKKDKKDRRHRHGDREHRDKDRRGRSTRHSRSPEHNRRR